MLGASWCYAEFEECGKEASPYNSIHNIEDPGCLDLTFVVTIAGVGALILCVICPCKCACITMYHIIQYIILYK